MATSSNATPRRRPAAYWRLPEPANKTSADLATALSVEPLVATILVGRGLPDVDAARRFLHPKLDQLHDPLLMRDMGGAVSRLERAISENSPVLICGDYDVDGASSTAVLKKCIELLGGTADFHIPHRLKEGYGMRSEVVDWAAANGFGLIVSVDTGIRAHEVVRHANASGIDVVVTDHHLAEAEVPAAHAVLNPNRPGCDYPNKHLCGAGVVFKLVQALLTRSDMAEARRNALLDSFLKPVAIATVADIVPLTGENRVIVKRGLSGLRRVRNAGLKALLTVAGFEDGECPSAHQVAFRLAPRMNAAGRMASARDVVELFLTDQADRARELAEQLDALNRDRQRVEAEIVRAILHECETRPPEQDCAALVFAGENWHLGVLGIVASRLVEQFGRPVFVLSDAAAGSEADRHLSGSGRSIPAFHLLEALESMPELFTKFGGHRQAAGLSLQARQLEEFQRRFGAFASSRLTSEDFRPRHEADAQARLSDLSERCVEQILSLGPFGFGNPSPNLFVTGVELAEPPRTIGTANKHFTLRLRQNGRTLSCKAWNFGSRVAELPVGAKLDVLLQIEDDPYSKRRGYASWCLLLKDFREAERA